MSSTRRRTEDAPELENAAVVRSVLISRRSTTFFDVGWGLVVGIGATVWRQTGLPLDEFYFPLDQLHIMGVEELDMCFSVGQLCFAVEELRKVLQAQHDDGSVGCASVDRTGDSWERRGNGSTTSMGCDLNVRINASGGIGVGGKDGIGS